MKIIQIATALGYEHYGDYTVEELDNLPLSNEDKQVELYLIQSWLRKTFDIDITIVIRFMNSYGVFIHQNRHPIKDNQDKILELLIDPSSDNHGVVYETALLEGIKQGLKLILK